MPANAMAGGTASRNVSSLFVATHKSHFLETAHVSPGSSHPLPSACPSPCVNTPVHAQPSPSLCQDPSSRGSAGWVKLSLRASLARQVPMKLEAVTKRHHRPHPAGTGFSSTSFTFPPLPNMRCTWKMMLGRLEPSPHCCLSGQDVDPGGALPWLGGDGGSGAPGGAQGICKDFLRQQLVNRQLFQPSRMAEPPLPSVTLILL